MLKDSESGGAAPKDSDTEGAKPKGEETLGTQPGSAAPIQYHQASSNTIFLVAFNDFWKIVFDLCMMFEHF